jgi:hypothetical protein
MLYSQLLVDLLLIVNDEVERMCEEIAVVYFKV